MKEMGLPTMLINSYDDLEEVRLLEVLFKPITIT